MKIFCSLNLGKLLCLTAFLVLPLASPAFASQSNGTSQLSSFSHQSIELGGDSEYSALTERQSKRKIRARATQKCEDRNAPNIRQCVRKILDRVDADRDGKRKLRDNCPTVANFEQNDNDDDSVGDACDNCPVNSNGNQSDTDDDGVGNACDGDSGAPSV